MNHLRRLLAVGAVGAAAATTAAVAALGYAYYIEPQAITLEKLTLRLPRAQGRLPAEGLRILHLSDSHFRNATRREEPKLERIRSLTQGLEYDLLVHTGDLIQNDNGVEMAFRLLAALPEPRLGRYVVLGNHDYMRYQITEAFPRMFRTWRRKTLAQGAPAWSIPFRARHFLRYVRNTPLDGRRTGPNNAGELARRLQCSGFKLMHNCVDHVVDPQRGIDLYVAGVDDVSEGRPRLGQTLEDVPDNAPVVLLSHNPDIVASPQLERIDLVLAGHTHGGQIVLPLWGPAHTQSWELKRHEVSGYFRRGATHVYVTRGIGGGIPLRFGAPPQIALITLLPGE